MDKPKILIVDDDADLRLALTTRLRANHYDTVQAIPRLRWRRRSSPI
jgi:DNA-binding response OmpR family regulator